MNNATNGTEAPQAQMDYVVEPLGLRIFRLTVYVIIFLLATFGNALVIFVVYKTRALHTVTGFLIANLAVADLGVGMLCIPFTVVYFELDFHWPFGAFMCKLLPALMACFVMGSVGTMLAISLDRHQSIVHPFGMRITRYQGKLIMLLIWLIALLPALPMLGVMTTEPYPAGVACKEDWPITTGMPYSTIYLLCTFALTYAIPLPIMILIYIKIGVKLRKAIKEGADRPGFTQAQATKRIIKMLAAVVVCYALCFLPFHTLYFMIDFGEYQSRFFPILQSFSSVFMYSNSASNPVLYAFFGDQFKMGVKQVFNSTRLQRFRSRKSTSYGIIECQTKKDNYFSTVAPREDEAKRVTSTCRSIKYPGYMYIMQSYFQVLMYGNSATNPVLYAFLGDQFKKGFKRAIRGGSQRGFYTPRSTMSTRASSTR
ncbi:hypothetical protein pdam_00013897 [Pocillopora damicornis]|uniref:G-protein coupled receptors family 1 profile domain-containing protein n=1 Tax=Pocillopora damicornis TaxID=46731 RepID=A0A3M6UL59_POCDA|nr:hypothetical protein pdam_00013897 [Pocillopora damicornis]